MEHVISFPALGLEFTLNRVAAHVFGLDIYWYGIIICIGFILAALYVNARVKEFGVTSDNLVDCLIICVPVGIICARIYYVVFNGTTTASICPRSSRSGTAALQSTAR